MCRKVYLKFDNTLSSQHKKKIERKKILKILFFLSERNINWNLIRVNRGRYSSLINKNNYK